MRCDGCTLEILFYEWGELIVIQHLVVGRVGTRLGWDDDSVSYGCLVVCQHSCYVF